MKKLLLTAILIAAAGMLASLDRPAARQMLVYHHKDPSGSAGEPDSLRGELLDDLADRKSVE